MIGVTNKIGIMNSNYLTALCCDQQGKWYKYRNIRKHKMESFEKFAKLKNIRYINYYDKETKQFAGRKYL